MAQKENRWRGFDCSKLPDGLLTAETMMLVSAVHEAKGCQSLHTTARQDVLNALVEVAKIQSAEASNLIEGIRDSDKRLREIMADRTDLRSRDEKEVERTKGRATVTLWRRAQTNEEIGENDPSPFVHYMLGFTLAAYRDFESRIDAAIGAKMTKAQHIEAFLGESVGKVTKSQIPEACPDISQTTVERVLHEPLEDGKKSRKSATTAEARTSGRAESLTASNSSIISEDKLLNTLELSLLITLAPFSLLLPKGQRIHLVLPG